MPCSTCINTKGRGGAKFVEWWTRTRCLLDELKDSVHCPSDFVFAIVEKEKFAVVIMTL
jgi:hypothetical protein